MLQTGPKFNQRLLEDDFEYDDEPDGTPGGAAPKPPEQPSLESLGTLLANPDVLKQLQVRAW